MVIYRAKNYKELSRKAANIICAQVILKPNCVLGLATGSSPVGIYKQLVDWYKKGDLDFSRVSSINLDEYRGLGPDNEQSYQYFMNTNLFNHVNIDPEKACLDYDRIIEKSGGIDLQLLGLGHNGHIGFNEPSHVFPRGTHCVDLAPSTIEANKRFFSSEADVPRQAYTMGIREDKAEILRQVIRGPITPDVPASVLQLHTDVVIVADEAALSQM